MTCANCKHFDGFDAIRSNLINCDLYDELSKYDAEDMCLGYEEKEKMVAPKLYRLWSGDSNDRNEFYRVKAHDIDQVIDWIKLESNNEILNHETFNNDQLIHEIDYQDSDLTYIMLNNCLQCDNYNVKKMKPRRSTKCEYCELCSAYIEINETPNPQPGDFSFKVIYPIGQDNYIDLTK